MDTVSTLLPTTDSTRPAPRARLELTWTLRTRDEKTTLSGRWVVIEPAAVNRCAA